MTVIITIHEIVQAIDKFRQILEGLIMISYSIYGLIFFLEVLNGVFLNNFIAGPQY